MNEKPIQTLQELAQNLKADCYYFVSQFGLGDTYYLCAFKHELEKKWRGKIIFVIQSAHEVVCECFANSQYIICSDTRHKGINYLNLPQWSDSPKLGKLYPAHPIPLGILQDLRYNNMTDLYVKFLDLPSDSTMAKPTNMPTISATLRAKIETIAPLDKIIFYLPEANSMMSLPLFIYKNECKDLQKEGYTIIVNVTKGQKYLSAKNVYMLNLSTKEAVALALVCARVISMRSGFCDVIAINCKNLKVYYPSKECIEGSSLKWIDTNITAQEVSFEVEYQIMQNFYKSLLPLKLYKRYATKGFLRKLRLPFTAYFKIYRRYKNGVLQDFGATNLALKDFSDKEVRELIEQELMQSYEYQLGLALQKACERFWCGGFLLFPLSYLKIRKEKGKGFKRIDVLS